MDLLFVLVLFIGGFLGGLYAGSVGGGALVGFPLLILTGLPTHAAIATQRFAAVILESSSALRFYKGGKMNWKVGAALGVFAAAGSVIGANVIINIDEKYLDLIIAAILLVVFVAFYDAERIKVKEKVVDREDLVKAALFTFLFGIYGGFFGAGFGTFILILLVWTGFTFLKSAAIGRVVGIFMSSAGALVFAYYGLINLAYGLSLGAGFALGSWLGIGFALKKGDRYVQILVSVVIILTILKLVLNFFGVDVI